jgi:hypothetical protein
MATTSSGVGQPGGSECGLGVCRSSALQWWNRDGRSAFRLMIECMASLLRIQERLILCMGLDGFILYPTKFVSDVASIASFVIVDAVDVFAVDCDVGEG